MVGVNSSRTADWAEAALAFIERAVRLGKSVQLTVVEKTFSPTEVAHLVGLSRSSVHRAIQAGDLRATRVGSRYRISEDEMERFRAKTLGHLADLFANDF
jgi:excisionase family DNA binding protein